VHTTVNGPSRNQPATPRRPIVLRAPESSTEAHTDALFAANDDPQTRLLRDEISKLHQTLEQWSSAEGEWSHQRRLFEVMTENVSDLIVLLDPQGNRTWNNPAYSHSIGYGPQELAGTFAMTEVHTEDKQRAIDSLTETLQKGTTTQAEYRVQQKDGDWISLQTENVPILDAAGRVETVVLMAHDVTEKKKLEESLALASTSANAAGLVEGMARDFDQILTNVVGNLTIAKNLNGPHNAIAVRLNEMERSLQRARDLIEQMFSIAPHAGAAEGPRLARARRAGGRLRPCCAARWSAPNIFSPATCPRSNRRGSLLARHPQHRHQFRAGDGQGRRTLFGGEHSAIAILLPSRPAAQGRRLRLPPHPGPRAWHLRKSAAARFRALLHHAQRLAGSRPHHRALDSSSAWAARSFSIPRPA
jgi:PAS domain S-box-containing protein